MRALGLRGVRVEMAGTDYVVPPLTFRQIQDLHEILAGLAAVQGVPSADQITGIAEIVRTALARNYPDITLEQVMDMLDMGNVNDVLMAVLGASGLVKPGEAQAASV
jgi:hypothetical protein